MSQEATTDNNTAQADRKAIPVRTQARRAVLQALYQWQLNPSNFTELEMQFVNNPTIQLGNKPFFSDLLKGVLDNIETVDAAFVGALDRPIVQLNPVELSVLRLGTYELLAMPETPYRVIINESIELAKTFGAEGGHAYVNGVLDKLGKTLRATELASV
jgi:N utilization substance protein B